ncbi:MAG TPA: TetR/AcrR family transcriptional regulator [Candidatus Yaniella excrementavium]|nr:TetR/AcrR family transcriptional regulator [Candidatus Yaniella excrementavium]
MQSETDPKDQRPISFIEQARRDQIIAAAAETVAAVGYAHASLARIATTAGISKGVVTYHFRSKDEILRLVVTRFFDQAWAYMEPRITAEATAVEQIKMWIRTELEYFGSHRTEFLAMSDIVANHRDAEGDHAFANEFEEEVSGLTDLLLQGQHDGQLRDFDVVSVANIILRCLEGVLTSWALDSSVNLDDQIPVLLDFIDHAIGADCP